MANKVHFLKIKEVYFDAVKQGIKTFEIRRNDRSYEVGDFLELHAVDEFGEYKEGSENVCKAEITYITDYEQKHNFIVMAIRLV